MGAAAAASDPDLFVALSEPRRQAIVRLVLERGELAAGDIHRAIGEVTFGAISQHLRVLERAGALSVRRQGRSRLYRAHRAALRPVRGYLERLWTRKLDDLKALAEAEEAAAAADEASRAGHAERAERAERAATPAPPPKGASR